jgi:hypothetical protein
MGMKKVYVPPSAKERKRRRAAAKKKHDAQLKAMKKEGSFKPEKMPKFTTDAFGNIIWERKKPRKKK